MGPGLSILFDNLGKSVLVFRLAVLGKMIITQFAQSGLILGNDPGKA
jgi:hypothetical protein